MENTTEGLKRDLAFMKKVSEESKVHVVAGTGHYIADLQEEKNRLITKEGIYNHMLTELQDGCIDYSSIKAGFMGEIASVWPIKGMILFN